MPNGSLPPRHLHGKSAFRPFFDNSPFDIGSEEGAALMRRNTGTRHTDDSDDTSTTRSNRHPSTTKVVALVDGMTASIGGTYVLTSSVLITALAGVLAVAVVALHFIFGS